MQFLPDLDNFSASIEAGLADGSLVEWRTDSTGRQWYRSSEDEILGIAPDAEIKAVRGDQFSDEELIEAADLVDGRDGGEVVSVSYRQRALLVSLGLADA